MSRRRQRGFSILELMIVIVILLIIAAVSAPRMLQILDAQKLQTSAQAYAGLLQQARARAVQDNVTYQVLTSNLNNAPLAYVDLNLNQQYDSGGANPEPAVQLANPIVVTDTGAPAGFDTIALLNIIPYNLETSPMVDTTGAATPGLAFNDRGLPCQRLAATANCTNATVGAGLPPSAAWVTYLRYTRRDGGFDWAAVTVTPAGRIRTWRYQKTSGGGGSWQ